MRTEQAHDPNNLHCGKCNKLLAKGHIEAEEIELFCPRCKSRIVLRASRPNIALPQSGNDASQESVMHSLQTSGCKSALFSYLCGFLAFCLLLFPELPWHRAASRNFPAPWNGW